MRLHDEVLILDGAGGENAFPWCCRNSQVSMCHIVGLYLRVLGKQQLILFIEVIPVGFIFGKEQLFVSKDISVGNDCLVPPTFVEVFAERRCE